MSNEHGRAWGTYAELEFIRELGSHSEGHHFRRCDLMRGYARAIECRGRWGSIDPVAVRQEIAVLLAHEDMVSDRR